MIILKDESFYYLFFGLGGDSFYVHMELNKSKKNHQKTMHKLWLVIENLVKEDIYELKSSSSKHEIANS